MPAKEVEVTRYGEMLDMIACMSIEHGATPKKKRKMMSQEDIFLPPGVRHG